MHHTDYVEVVSNKGPASVSTKTTFICVVMMVIGFGAFAYQAFVNTEQPRIGWISFLHNLYFFTGLSAAGVLIAAILQTANAHWGRPIKRFAEASGAFMPVGIIGIAVIWFLGAEHLYEWVTDPPTAENKHFWLTKNFVFMRDIAALAILWLVGRTFVNTSVRPDQGLAHEKNSSWTRPANWKGLEEEVRISQSRQWRLGPIYCALYAVVISLLAFDLIKSLDYRWVSTMFGGWNFTTFMLLAWTFHYTMTHFMSKRFGVEKYMSKPLYHDLGKLTLGFTIVWGYLFFAQWLVIWYGNLGHEAGYLITRFEVAPWKTISRVVFVMVFLLPFIIGLGKKLKMQFKTFLPIIVISSVGIWLERFMLIAPSTWYYDRRAEKFMDGVGALLISDILVFFGFLGLFLLMYLKFLYKRPIMVISDPKLDAGINRH